jgi:hypothetical protein
MSVQIANLYTQRIVPMAEIGRELLRQGWAVEQPARTLQILGGVGTIIWFERLPMYRRCYDFRAAVRAEPAYSLPVEAIVEASVPLESTLAYGDSEEGMRQEIHAALLEALPDDFWPSWAPI